MRKTMLIFISLNLLCAAQSFGASKASKSSGKAQVLDFDGMDIKNSKGSPRDSFSSSKEKADFEYFFKTKISFKKKIIESLEAVR